MPLLLITLSVLTAAVFLALAMRPGDTAGRIESARAHLPPRTERIRGRILFVSRRHDELVLDCVAGSCHPAMCTLAPGTPFTLSVEPVRPSWFADAVEAMVARWAEEGTLVELLVTVGPDGERVDVRGDRSRVRLDVRDHAGLT
ncbi:MAG TPA: hypothetical protein VHF47_05530 [Acidimicrobiales bacterium]|nr:hypothetical protein [Acidimicrobiales bacterium]